MTDKTGDIGFEETLWKAADKFETKFNALIEEGAGFEEDRDEYEAENNFWVPKEANSLPALKEKIVENSVHFLA